MSPLYAAQQDVAVGRPQLAHDAERVTVDFWLERSSAAISLRHNPPETMSAVECRAMPAHLSAVGWRASSIKKLKCLDQTSSADRISGR
jgi:hypothetical protein